MSILKQRPPEWIWDEVHRLFKIDDQNTIFTYGEDIYNPGDVPLDSMLRTHEGVHMSQQGAYEGGKDAWWRDYLKNASFRAEQEVEAYRAQYGEFCRVCRDRNTQARYLNELAGMLASDMYGSPIPKQEALLRIKSPK